MQVRVDVGKCVVLLLTYLLSTSRGCILPCSLEPRSCTGNSQFGVKTNESSIEAGLLQTPDESSNLLRRTVHTLTPELQSALFGKPRSLFPPGSIGSHPRVLFNKDEWNERVDAYKKSGPFYTHMETTIRQLTVQGKAKAFFEAILSLDPSSMSEDELAQVFTDSPNLDEPNNGFALLALRAFVEADDQLLSNAISICYNWARVLIAHANKYDCYNLDVECFYDGSLGTSKLYNPPTWNLHKDKRTAVYGLGMTYDILYDKMGTTTRRTVQKAISGLARGKVCWGMDLAPGRLVSNWVTYGCQIYLANLAIEGEGHDEILMNTYPSAVGEYMQRAIYPDGGAIEDGYVAGLAMREGSDVLIALARRGCNYLDTAHFRNFVYTTAQMFEPWFCGKYIGGSSGGSAHHGSFLSMVRYVYPDGAIPKMLWRQQMGDNFIGDGVCRTKYTQTAGQMYFYGDNHALDAAKDPSALVSMPLFLHNYQRGMVITKSGHSTDALYTHFDARGDAFYLGHDNADRGTFTLSAYGKTWIPDLPWRYWRGGIHHSIPFIDGQTQTPKAPSVKMLRTEETGSGIILTAADLTAAYSTTWYGPNGYFPRATDDFSKFGYIPETASPYEYGWAANAQYDRSIGLPKSLYGNADFGFAGMYVWKKPLIDVDYVIRSTVHVQGSGRPDIVSDAYMIVVDKMSAPGDTHSYTFQLILGDDVTVDHGRSTRRKVVLADKTDPSRFLDVIIASTRGSAVSYEVVQMKSPAAASIFANALRITSSAVSEEEFWIVLHPRGAGTSTELRASYDTGRMHISVCGCRSRQFMLDDMKAVIEVGTGSTIPPMHPMLLTPFQGMRVPFKEFNRNASMFLLPADGYELQKVFHFNPPRSRRRRPRTLLTACTQYTRGIIKLTLLRCTDYEQRDCEVVENVEHADCRGSTQLTAHLSGPHVIVVQMKNGLVDGKSPRVALRLKRSK